MSFSEEIVSAARPAKGFDVAPYRVKSFPKGNGLSCVCNAYGFNCTTFITKETACMTTLDDATEIARRWNMA